LRRVCGCLGLPSCAGSSPCRVWSAVGIEAKGAVHARNCFTNFCHLRGGRSCMEMDFALGYSTFL
jgi:hypothetical protein